MKSMLILAGVLVATSSVAFTQDCPPPSRTSNDNAAGMGASSHGRVLTQADQQNCWAPQSQTSNTNAAGLGASMHGRLLR
jgi:hypothetical protein